MATKEHRRSAKSLIEGLEHRVHVGPPIVAGEISSAREFLLNHDFSPSSDYFNRLGEVQHRLSSRNAPPVAAPSSSSSNGSSFSGKTNYGGEAAGYWMQVQCAYDHIILSTCYEGEFHTQHGRIKISHRFNEMGRIDFVEAKLLRSLQPSLNGEIRKLVLTRNFQGIQKRWNSSEVFILPVLPRELIFLYDQIFRNPREEVIAWLVNIGHRLAEDLLTGLQIGMVNGVKCGRTGNRENENTVAGNGQLPLATLKSDSVAMPILQEAAELESHAEILNDRTALLSYSRRL